MKYESIAFIAFVVIVFGGLGYLFTSLTEGVNEPVTKGAAVQTETIEDASEPPAGPIVDGDAPIVLGSPSITTNQAKDEIIVNFNQCEPGGGSVESGSTSVNFTMQGRDGNDCVISYSAGDASATCRIPASLGQQRFPLSDDAPNLSTIERYCE
jgi:hypothetical protein